MGAGGDEKDQARGFPFLGAMKLLYLLGPWAALKGRISLLP